MKNKLKILLNLYLSTIGWNGKDILKKHLNLKSLSINVNDVAISGTFGKVKVKTLENAQNAAAKKLCKLK